MELDYKLKKNKYHEKIEKKFNSITFTPETIVIISSLINYWSFLKEVLKANNISRGCSLNNELQIRIKIGEIIHIFVPNYKTLVTYNDVSMMVELMELINNINNGLVILDLSDQSKFHGLLSNAVILGYIFLLNLNNKIKFKSINGLNPFTKKIVQMVLEVNKMEIPVDKDEDEDDSLFDC
jgi:hypothetical protein